MSDAPPLGSPLSAYMSTGLTARASVLLRLQCRARRGRTAEQAALAEAIVLDLRAHRALTGPRRLASVYLGGGTPSLMAPEWAAMIIGEARALWDAEDDLEVTLEANPTDAEAERFQAFAAAGVKRLSLGVQSLDDDALPSSAAIIRRPTPSAPPRPRWTPSRACRSTSSMPCPARPKRPGRASWRRSSPSGPSISRPIS